MNYKEFKEVLIEMVEERLEGTGISVVSSTTLKNNHTEKEMLTFHEKNITGMPVLYFGDLYSCYAEHGDMEDVLKFVMDTLKLKSRISVDEVVGKWELVKDSLSLRIVNFKWNEEKIENYIYKRYLDLAVLVQIEMNNSLLGHATTLVTKPILEHWKVSEEELWEVLRENLYNEEFEIRSLQQVVEEMTDWEMEDTDESSKLYVLRNREGWHGARAFLRNDLLRKFADRVKSDFYVLPSSIHELLLIASDGSVTEEQLRSMVCEVNADVVAKEERLSNNIYFYNFRESRLVVA